MLSIKEGKYISIEDDNVHDEVGNIIKTYNQMVNSIDNLINDNYLSKIRIQEVELKKNEAELYALESQINPHFLFNTLESIRMKLHNSNELEASKMILNLSKIIRQNLDKKSDMITIFDEMDIVESFLQIQKFRFVKKLDYSIDLPPSIIMKKVPKFSIQTLVENAILHGLDNAISKGEIIITASKGENFCMIHVIDNGCGIKHNKLIQIKHELDNYGELNVYGSLGLLNVHERLKLYYGDKSGLSIESIEGKGTKVSIILPDTNT